MAKLTIVVTGEDIIDNAVIYLEDPGETIEYKLNPKSDKKWSTEVTLPIEGPLEYSLYVVAFTGTRFTCTITRDDKKTIELSDTTGRRVRHRANVKGSAEFS